MKSIFLREQERYSKNALKDLFECNSEKIEKLIKKLKSYGILKLVKNNDNQKDLSDLYNEDIQIIDDYLNESDYLYVFTYVGIIILEEFILKCYPKYISESKKPETEFKMVLKVLEKYNDKKQTVQIYEEYDSKGSLNILSIMIFLLHDYYESGVYNNLIDIFEINGDGEILWDKTINETFTFFSNKRPFYPDLITKKHIDNDYDYFKRLHECILTECSNRLKRASLLDAFDLEEVSLFDGDLADFGETEYVLYKLTQEINIQFNTRKQRLLKCMYSFINYNDRINDVEYLNLFGTNNFNLLWEDICSEVMDNKLDVKLSELNLPIDLNTRYNPNNTLKSLIEKPKWNGYESEIDSSMYFTKIAERTLIPDTISVKKVEDEYCFIIFDAKYYYIQFEKNKPLKNVPGIESITKQYLYQLAYKDFIKDHNLKVHNCFLMPTEANSVIKKGFVYMDILDSLGLEKIEIYLLPAEKMFKLYLKNEKFDINTLL